MESNKGPLKVNWRRDTSGTKLRVSDRRERAEHLRRDKEQEQENALGRGQEQRETTRKMPRGRSRSRSKTGDINPLWGTNKRRGPLET